MVQDQKIKAQNSIADRARPEINAMTGYQSARSLFQSDETTIFLDANEAPFTPYAGGNGLNRYPDQQPESLINALCRLYDVSSRHLIAARGADEVIDIMVRAFCVAGKDNVLICPPTFAMYEQAALLQNAEVKKVPLTQDAFSLDIDQIKAQADENTKIIFICSPNNPTGNPVDPDYVTELCEFFDHKALIVLDETYSEYSSQKSFIPLTDRYENLIVLRTLSKSHAAAGLRCGVGIAQQNVIDLLRKVLAPYPFSQPVINEAVRILDETNQTKLHEKRQALLSLRETTINRLKGSDQIEKVYPTDCNYVLVKVKDAKDFDERLKRNNIIVRNQSHNAGLENCFRITIGTKDEMDDLIAALSGQSFVQQKSYRSASITRKTKETSIGVTVNLDRSAPVLIDTGVGFYDHMLDQIAKHAGISLQIECDGDLEIDPHHTVEDCAIALGQALKKALGDKAGIERYGFTVPMDEAQASAVLDLSGRFYFDFKINDGDGFPEPHVGDLPTDMVHHIFYSLAEHLQANLHIEVTGENTHHMVEGCFKAFARALKKAIRQDGDAMPSTKGVI